MFESHIEGPSNGTMWVAGDMGLSPRMWGNLLYPAASLPARGKRQPVDQGEDIGVVRSGRQKVCRFKLPLTAYSP